MPPAAASIPAASKLASIPTAFLGTAYVLEYLAIPNIHKAVTFLRGHGEENGRHVAALLTP